MKNVIVGANFPIWQSRNRFMTYFFLRTVALRTARFDPHDTGSNFISLQCVCDVSLGMAVQLELAAHTDTTQTDLVFRSVPTSAPVNIYNFCGRPVITEHRYDLDNQIRAKLILPNNVWKTNLRLVDFLIKTNQVWRAYILMRMPVRFLDVNRSRGVGGGGSAACQIFWVSHKRTRKPAMFCIPSRIWIWRFLWNF